MMRIVVLAVLVGGCYELRDFEPGEEPFDLPPVGESVCREGCDEELPSATPPDPAEPEPEPEPEPDLPEPDVPEPTPPGACAEGAKRCVDGDRYVDCVGGAWSAPYSCSVSFPGTHCGGDGWCVGPDVP